MAVGVEQSASGWDLYFAGLNIDPTHDETEQKLRRRAAVRGARKRRRLRPA